MLLRPSILMVDLGHAMSGIGHASLDIPCIPLSRGHTLTLFCYTRGLGISFSPAHSGMSEDVLGSQESTTSTAYLEPFGGADRFYPPPSPLKPRPANDVSTSVMPIPPLSYALGSNPCLQQ